MLHAELESECGQIVMIGGTGGHALTSPVKLGGASALLALYVGDVEAHRERALAAGAVLQADLEDRFWGDRVYEARDPEGHVWMICQRVRDVAPEDWPRPE